MKINSSIRNQNFLGCEDGLITPSQIFETSRPRNPTIQPYIPCTTSCKKHKTQIRICKFL